MAEDALAPPGKTINLPCACATDATVTIAHIAAIVLKNPERIISPPNTAT